MSVRLPLSVSARVEERVSSHIRTKPRAVLAGKFCVSGSKQSISRWFRVPWSSAPCLGTAAHLATVRVSPGPGNPTGAPFSLLSPPVTQPWLLACPDLRWTHSEPLLCPRPGRPRPVTSILVGCARARPQEVGSVSFPLGPVPRVPRTMRPQCGHSPHCVG